MTSLYHVTVVSFFAFLLLIVSVQVYLPNMLMPSTQQLPSKGVKPLHTPFIKYDGKTMAHGSTKNKNEEDDDFYWCWTKRIVGGTVAGGLAVAATPLAIGAAGFTGAGIAAGSLAAKGMAMAAAANGGGVVAGGVIATLQSVGAAGLGLGAKVGIATSVGSAWAYMTGGCYKGNCDENKNE